VCTWWRGYSGLAVQNCGEAFGSQGAHAFLKRASQVGHEVVEFGKFVAHAVETSWWAVALDGRVSSFVGAHVCMFVGEVPCSAADTAPFVFQGFCAVLHVMVE
jgi:hypothetical protein